MSIVTKIIFIVLWLIALGVGVFFVLNDPNIASMISYSFIKYTIFADGKLGIKRCLVLNSPFFVRNIKHI